MNSTLSIRRQQYWPARQISTLLTVVAIILWSYSIVQAEFTIGFFGLIHSFPITFFIALGLLTIASTVLWVSKENHSKMLFLQLSLLILSLWLVPLLIGGSQPCAEHIREKFFSAGGFNGLIQGGHLNPAVAWYHNWPSLFILAAALVDISGISNIEPFFFLAPFLLQLAFLLAAYILFKNLFPQKTNYCWAGLWIFELANWGGVNYFGSNAYAMLLLLFILFFFTKTWPQVRKVKEFGYRLSNILFFACLTITHLLSSFAGFAIVAALFVFRRVKSPTFPAIVATFIVIWMIYQTTSFFEARLPDYVEHAFRLDLLVSGWASLGSAVVGNESHQAVSRIRILFSAMFVAIVFTGFILGRKSKKEIYNDNSMLAVGLGLLFILLSMLYAYELLQRVWFFMLPIIAYFSVKLLNHKSTAVILSCLLLLALPLWFIAHYGNQAADYRSPTYVAGSNYVKVVQDSNDYPVTKPGVSLATKEKPALEDILPAETSCFVISQRDASRWKFIANEPLFIDEIQAYLNYSSGYSCIYSNPDFNLYLGKGKP